MSEEAKGGNNKGMMLIIVAMLAVIILALAGVAVFLIMNMGGDDEVAGGPVQGWYSEVPSALDQRIFDLGDSITTNLLSSGPGSGNNFVVVNLSLGINNLDEDDADDFWVLLAERQPVVRDAVTSILRRATAEELRRPDGADIIREDILTALQSVFASHMIVEVYFNQFTVH
ncbi:MAG: flagellar basal body-associated FliL family protein [Defluviitaleaceae bacterium]|nr:flagellar basal body-associated FliL family protein [Defluviitaleaceae bacterium]